MTSKWRIVKLWLKSLREEGRKMHWILNIKYFFYLLLFGLRESRGQHGQRNLENFQKTKQKKKTVSEIREGTVIWNFVCRMDKKEAFEYVKRKDNMLYLIIPDVTTLLWLNHSAYFFFFFCWNMIHCNSKNRLCSFLQLLFESMLPTMFYKDFLVSIEWST